MELTAERERHIGERHPELLPDYRDHIELTIADPDQVRRSKRFQQARLFSRWYTNIRGGKHVVVVVVSDSEPHERHWVITAYIARKLEAGEVEWTKS